MRRTLAVTMLVMLVVAAGCSDDSRAKDVTETTTAPTTAVTTTAAAATSPDLTADVLGSYPQAKELLDSRLGSDRIAAAVARLDAAIPAQEWNAEMFAALDGSFCNDWDAEDAADGGVGPLTEKGRSDWAAAIAGPLHLSPADARAAVNWIESDADFSPPCQ